MFKAIWGLEKVDSEDLMIKDFGRKTRTLVEVQIKKDQILKQY